MADWIYCGSESAVNAAGTQSLLQMNQAIWCSPPGLRPWPATPESGERLWLLWRQAAAAQPILLLGGGRILQAPRGLFGTNLLWTNPDVPGLRNVAEDLGYRGGTSMTFLRLTDVVVPDGQPVAQGLGTILPGLNIPSPPQLNILAEILPIP